MRAFEEKLRRRHWANGGFFVVSAGIDRYLDGDDTVWEQEPMRSLAGEGELACYRHEGFWQAMDRCRDRNHLDELWSSGEAPWRTWGEHLMATAGAHPPAPSIPASGGIAGWC